MHFGTVSGWWAKTITLQLSWAASATTTSVASKHIWWNEIDGIVAGKMMSEKAKKDGVNVKYQEDKSTPTGTCAVLITNDGLQRSLCAFMGASEKLDKDHLIKNWTFAEKARIFVTSGHMLGVR